MFHRLVSNWWSDAVTELLFVFHRPLATVAGVIWITALTRALISRKAEGILFSSQLSLLSHHTFVYLISRKYSSLFCLFLFPSFEFRVYSNKLHIQQAYTYTLPAFIFNSVLCCFNMRSLILTMITSSLMNVSLWLSECLCSLTAKISLSYTLLLFLSSLHKYVIAEVNKYINLLVPELFF